jgi:hypothetical protein
MAAALGTTVNGIWPSEGNEGAERVPPFRAPITCREETWMSSNPQASRSSWETQHQSSDDRRGPHGWLNRWRGVYDSTSVAALPNASMGTADDGTATIGRHTRGRWVVTVIRLGGPVEIKHGRTQQEADESAPIVVINPPRLAE